MGKERSAKNLNTSERNQNISLEEYTNNNTYLYDAYDCAQKAHNGVTRADGTPYITHPVAVSTIMHGEWGINNLEILAAGYLHDTIEDTEITKKDLEIRFGQKVANWVDGVSKFVSDNKEEVDRETKKKQLNGGFLDPIDNVLKLGDRLHNMRTMGSMPPHKQIAKSEETLNVFAPLAESMGMWKVKTELENLAFKYTDPEKYAIHLNEVNDDERTKPEFTVNLISQIEQMLRSSGIEAQVSTRLNSIVRLKNKRERSHLKSISDMISFRITVDENGDTARQTCYAIVGELRNHFGDMEDLSRFSDAYNSPRENGYSAMHMIINTHAGAVEIAITSKEKEDFNDWGIITLIRKGEQNLSEYSLKLVFTPTGKAKIMSREATGVDFAYSITDDFGNLADSIWIDGKKYPITVVIPHGATVKVELGEGRNWPAIGIENYAQSKAKKRIEGQRKLETRQNEENIGRDIVNEIIENIGLVDLEDLREFKNTKISLKNFLYHLGCKGELENLYYQLGSGRMKSEYFSAELKNREFTKEKLGLSSILLEGADSPGLLEFFAKKVTELGCNIKFNKGIGNDGFIQRFVVEILSEEKKKMLREEFSKDSRIKKVVIV